MVQHLGEHDGVPGAVLPDTADQQRFSVASDAAGAGGHLTRRMGGGGLTERTVPTGSTGSAAK